MKFLPNTLKLAALLKSNRLKLESSASIARTLRLGVRIGGRKLWNGILLLGSIEWLLAYRGLFAKIIEGSQRSIGRIVLMGSLGIASFSLLLGDTTTTTDPKVIDKVITNAITEATTAKVTRSVTLKPLDKETGYSNSKIKFRRPFEVGEELRFKIKFLGLSGGEAVISAIPKDNKLMEFKIEARTSPWVEKIYKLHITMLSKTLLETYQTLRYTEDKRENKRVYYNVQDFDLKRKQYSFGYLKNGSLDLKYVNYPDIDGGMSVVSAFFFSRTIDLDIGTNIYTNCFFRDKYFQVGIEPIEVKTIATSFGRKEVVVIRPLLKQEKIISDQKDMLIYLSNDIARIPLRVEFFTGFGVIKALLTHYSSSPSSKSS